LVLSSLIVRQARCCNSVIRPPHSAGGRTQRTSPHRIYRDL